MVMMWRVAVAESFQVNSGYGFLVGVKHRPLPDDATISGRSGDEYMAHDCAIVVAVIVVL